jgi:hypothetical protein
MLTHFIKINYGSYERIINKKINISEYVSHYMKVFEFLNNKHGNLYYRIDTDNAIMYISQKTDMYYANWMSFITLSSNSKDFEMVDHCKLSLITIDNEIEI